MPEEDQVAPGHEVFRGVPRSPKHGGPSLAAPILTFDLQVELRECRVQPSYERGNPSGRTLVKESALRIVLLALRAGGCMREHQASGPISIQAIEGSIRVRVAGNTVELQSGSLLMLEAGLRHDVEAIEDSAFLLTIGLTRYEQVSDWHER